MYTDLQKGSIKHSHKSTTKNIKQQIQFVTTHSFKVEIQSRTLTLSMTVANVLILYVIIST